MRFFAHIRQLATNSAGDACHFGLEHIPSRVTREGIPSGGASLIHLPAGEGAGGHGQTFGFQGRRVDILGRSIDAAEGADSVAAVRRYLAQKPTGTAWHLATKAVVGVYPPNVRGKVIWPTG